MKFVQKSLGQAAEVNAGRRGSLIEYARFVVYIGCGFLLLNILVWGTVEIVVRNLSIEMEAAWFDFPEFGGGQEPVPDIYERVLDKLQSHPEVPALNYRLKLMDQDTPNAFAIAGGTIGITRGLAAVLDQDEIAIAFLLGHELGHFRNRDHLRGMGRAVLLGTCLRLLSPYGGSSMISGLTQNAILTSYSRKQEDSADRFGVRMVAHFYGETDGAVRLMNLLHLESGVPEWAYMFLTHPGPEQRIKEMESTIQSLQP